MPYYLSLKPPWLLAILCTFCFGFLAMGAFDTRSQASDAHTFLVLEPAPVGVNTLPGPPREFFTAKALAINRLEDLDKTPLYYCSRSDLLRQCGESNPLKRRLS